MARVAVVLSVLVVVAALVDCSPVEPRVPEDVAAGAESTPSLGVDAVLPEAIVPEATVLEATVPEATVPEATVLEASVPEATIPEADVPGAAEPKAAEPKAAEPKAAEPEAAEPKAAEPEAAEPEAAVPLNVTPEDAVAQIERESNSGPVVKQPEAPVDVIEGSSKFAEKETTYVSGAAENEEILPVAPEDEFSSTQISDEPLSENDFPLAVGDEFQDYPVDSEPTIDDQDFVLIVPDDEELSDSYNPTIAANGGFIQEGNSDVILTGPNETLLEEVSDLGNPESEPTEIDIAEILANADPNNNLITGSDPLPEAPIEDAIDPDFMIEQPDSVNSDGGDLLIDTAQLESSNNEEEISEQAPNEASIVVDETPVPDEPVMVIGVSGNDRPEPVAAPPSYDDYDQGMPDYSNNGPFVPPMVSDDYPIYDDGVPFMNEGPIVVPEPDYIDTPIHEDRMVFGVNEGETSYPPTNEENDGAVMDETNPSDETPNIFILKLYVRRPEAPPRRPLRHPVTSHLFNFVGNVLDKIAAAKGLRRPLPPPKNPWREVGPFSQGEYPPFFRRQLHRNAHLARINAMDDRMNFQGGFMGPPGPRFDDGPSGPSGPMGHQFASEPAGPPFHHGYDSPYYYIPE